MNLFCATGLFFYNLKTENLWFLMFSVGTEKPVTWNRLKQILILNAFFKIAISYLLFPQKVACNFTNILSLGTVAWFLKSRKADSKFLTLVFLGMEARLNLVTISGKKSNAKVRFMWIYFAFYLHLPDKSRAWL